MNWGGANNSTFNSFIYSVLLDAVGNVYAAGEFTNTNGKYYVAKYSQLLPLKLLSFTAQTQLTPNPSKEANILLNWQTANEVNISHINIQRSLNGKEFTTIGNVNASCCAYSYLDNRPPSNFNGGLSTIYYRLEIADKDGSKTYSEVRQLAISKEQVVISIYPNPAKALVTIDCKAMKVLRIINSLGQEVSRQEPRNDAAIINTKQFTKGVYVVQVTTTNGEMKTEKLVVQ